MKLIAKIIIIFAVFYAGFYIGQQYAIKPNLTDNEDIVENQDEEQIKVSLMLDFSNGQIKTFNNVIISKDKTTVFDLLDKITKENEIEFKYKDYGGEMGAMIESIGEIENDFSDDSWWQFWVNNQYSKVGVSNCQLYDGDIIEWKYIKGQLDN